jgi:hypothetical protein
MYFFKVLVNNGISLFISLSSVLKVHSITNFSRFWGIFTINLNMV